MIKAEYTPDQWKKMRLVFAERCFVQWQLTGEAHSEANMYSHLFLYYGDF